MKGFSFLSTSPFYFRCMQVDVLIVGQGISGTMLSWFLHKQGKSFLVIDEGKESTASSIAAGLINPVTGRRYVTTWMADTLMSWAKTTYSEITDFLNTSIIEHKDIIDFFASPQMLDAFTTRLAEDTPYIRTFPDQNSFNPYFHYDFGCGAICPAYVTRLSSLIVKWREYLQKKQLFRIEKFQLADMQLSHDQVKYGSIHSKKIIFCNGIDSMRLPWFEKLPFSAVKGQTLTIACDLPGGYIFKKGMILAPLAEGVFWYGSDYEWNFENDQPTEQFRKKSEDHLNSWLKLPYKIVDHKAAVRPATVERRPFVGFHPSYPQIGILNGLGSKGSSLAPYFAHQLVQNLIYNFPIAAEADIQRFTRLLSSN